MLPFQLVITNVHKVSKMLSFVTSCPGDLRHESVTTVSKTPHIIGVFFLIQSVLFSWIEGWPFWVLFSDSIWGVCDRCGNPNTLNETIISSNEGCTHAQSTHTRWGLGKGISRQPLPLHNNSARGLVHSNMADKVIAFNFILSMTMLASDL